MGSLQKKIIYGCLLCLIVFGAAQTAIAHAPLNGRASLAAAPQATADPAATMLAEAHAYYPQLPAGHTDLPDDPSNEHIAPARRSAHQPGMAHPFVPYLFPNIPEFFRPDARSSAAGLPAYGFHFSVATSDYHRFLFRLTPF